MCLLLRPLLGSVNMQWLTRVVEYMVSKVSLVCNRWDVYDVDEAIMLLTKLFQISLFFDGNVAT